MISIEKINDVYIKVHCEDAIAQELSDYFTFNVPNAKFSPLYKKKIWDGKIRLFSFATHLIYTGLLPYVELFLKKNNYQYETLNNFNDNEFSLFEANEFIKKLNLPLEPRDYQLDTFCHCIRKNRSLILSPTASGKSLIIYLLAKYYNEKILIVVPTTSLVHQMKNDFINYGCNDQDIHIIFSGQEKITEKPITITTWQSIYKLSKEWFKQYRCIIGDEAHLFKASSLTSIMKNMVDCPYRFGLTGTLDNTLTNKFVLEGHFGEVKQVITTAKLIENNTLAKFNIKAIILNYDDNIKKQLKKVDYFTEIDYINNFDPRNKFILNLACSLEGNTLLLFRMIDHGKRIFDLIKNKTSTPLFYVDGSIEGLKREEIRNKIEELETSITFATLGTFSTGVNIKNLHNVIFVSPSKSRIKTLQSIGRVLRQGNNKTNATLYDIVDDISWKSRKNYCLQHFFERIDMYDAEKFDYKIYKVNLRSN